MILTTPFMPVHRIKMGSGRMHRLKTWFAWSSFMDAYGMRFPSEFKCNKL